MCFKHFQSTSLSVWQQFKSHIRNFGLKPIFYGLAVWLYWTTGRGIQSHRLRCSCLYFETSQATHAMLRIDWNSSFQLQWTKQSLGSLSGLNPHFNITNETWNTAKPQPNFWWASWNFLICHILLSKEILLWKSNTAKNAF